MKTSQDVDDLLMGMASQIAEKEDNIVVEDLKGFSFSLSFICFLYIVPFINISIIFGVLYTLTDYMYGPLKFTRNDLVAMTIQRGRDFGLRSYTEMRKALDLPPVKIFEEINPEHNITNPQVKAAV